MFTDLRFQATNLVHFQYVLGSSSLNIFNRGKSKELEESSYELFEESELFREWICLRTKFTLKYTIESGYQEQLLSNLKATRTKLCETNKPIFKIDGTDIILKKDKGLVGIGKNAKVSAAILQAKKQQTDAVPSKFDVLNIVLAPGDDDANVDDVSSLFASMNSETSFWLPFAYHRYLFRCISIRCRHKNKNRF